MQQAGLLPIARRWWPVIVFAAVVAGLTANVVASRVPPTYEAQVTLLTGPINTDFGTLRASGDLARTYADLATSRPILEGTSRTLGLGLAAEDLRPLVSATSNDVTRLVRIRVRVNDAAAGARIANEIARRLTQLTAETPPEAAEISGALLEQPEIVRLAPETRAQIAAAAERLTQQPAEGKLQVVDPAVASDVPVAPRVSLITLLAIMAGVVGVGILILLVETSSDRIDEERLADVAEVPLLGSIGGTARWRGSRERGLVVEDSPGSSQARDYRLLATKIGLLDVERPTRTLLVVGTDSRSGGGAVAANLAAVLAQTDERVALVDASEAHAEVTRMLGLNGSAGYSDLLGRNGDRRDVEDVGVERRDGFVVLPGGQATNDTLLDIEHARDVLRRLLERYDRVVISAQAVGHSPATLVWAHVVDATVLVMRRGKSKHETVTESVRQLRLAGARVAGAVLRDSPRVLSRR